MSQAAADGSTAVQLTLLWQAGSPLIEDDTIRVEAVGPDSQPLTEVQDNTPPQDGEYPTSWWLPGEMVPFRYDFTIQSDYDGPIQFRVRVITPNGQRLPVYDAHGERLPGDSASVVTIQAGESAACPAQ